MLATILKNSKSGITVALVSLPLSISLAIASGVSPVQGIITALWAGLVGALCGGSNYNIIGPTGALSGFIAAYAITSGPALVPYLAVCVGIFIIVAYFLRLERYVVLIPSSVIHGFTLGVACIIILSQGKHIFGLYVEPSSFTAWLSAPLITFLFFLIVLLLLRYTECPIPGIIIIAPIGILVGWLTTHQIIPYSLTTLGGLYGSITPQLLNIRLVIGKPPLLPALAVALVALVETLLSAKIADTMTHTRHYPRREILGLGLANIVSGLLGGIPATAALARTALNIKAGASSRYSAGISSIFIGIISVGLLSFFSYIPMAVIAAILVFIAINMIEREHFMRLYSYDKSSFVIALSVALITIYEDPVVGILVGVVIALLLLVRTLLPGFYESKTVDDVLIYAIKGELVYLNSNTQCLRFQAIAHNHSSIILKLRDLNFMDLDGVEAFEDLIKTAHEHHQKIAIAHVPAHIYPLLHTASSEFRALEEKKFVFETTQEALQALKS